MVEEQAPPPGTPVTVPMADAQRAGTIVAAPVAPAQGQVTSSSAVVAVIPWQQSKKMLIALTGLLYSLWDLTTDVAVPIIKALLDAGEPLSLETLKKAAPSIALGVVSALIARYTIRDNRIVGKPPKTEQAPTLGSSPEIELPKKPVPRTSTEGREE